MNFRRFISLISSFLATQFLLLGQASGATTGNGNELVIYTYDKFVAPGGLGPLLFPLFEKKCQCRIRALPSGDGGQILTRLQWDAQRGKPTAHLILGIDQHLWQRSQPWVEGWKDWLPKNYAKIKDSVKVGSGFLPIDYGVLAFMVDRQTLAELKMSLPNTDSPIISLKDLLKPQWKRRFILEDPRTSTPGLAFLLLTYSLDQKSIWGFWQELKSQWLTLVPSWDKAYGLFLRKEAPLVWSYISSEAYHIEHRSQGSLPSSAESKASDNLLGYSLSNLNEHRYQAILFKEGQPLQIEGAAVVKGTAKTAQERKLVQSFLEFLISPEAQELIPQTLWMMPVRSDIALPASFKKLPLPTRIIPTPTQSQLIEDVLSQWTRAVGQSGSR